MAARSEQRRGLRALSGSSVVRTRGGVSDRTGSAADGGAGARRGLRDRHRGPPRSAAGRLGRYGRRYRHKRGHARGGPQGLVGRPPGDRVATGGRNRHAPSGWRFRPRLLSAGLAVLPRSVGGTSRDASRLGSERAPSAERPAVHRTQPGISPVCQGLGAARGTGRWVDDALAFPLAERGGTARAYQECGVPRGTILFGIAPVRYPSAEELLRWEGASSPLAGPIGALSEEVREALIRDLGRALRTYTDDAGIVFPAETYLAVALR